MTKYKRSLTVALAAATLGTSAGCASMNNTERGAAAGAGAGGAIGAVIGRRMDRQAAELDRSLEGAEVERVGEGIAVTFESGVLYPFDSDQVLPAGRANLQRLAASLREYPGTEVLIVGHTDSQGADDYNMRLSYRRAEAARQILINNGIRAQDVRVEGRGEVEPVADNSTERGRSQNRRVEIAIFASEQYREQVLRQNQ
jgi:outer membrane protein OmpA-like peptidoglycan-associated protein